MHGQGFTLTASRFREVDCVLRLVRGHSFEDDYPVRNIDEPVRLSNEPVRIGGLVQLRNELVRVVKNLFNNFFERYDGRSNETHQADF